jgi:hypothetical protein
MLTEEKACELDRLLRAYKRGLYTREEFIRRLGHVVRPENLAEIMKRIPFEFVESANRAAVSFRPVKAVGYWRSLLKYRIEDKYHIPVDDAFPDPKGLVNPAWRESERDSIVSYLRSGRVYSAWRGFSYCRFKCGIEDKFMGHRCLTDGCWVWPEGLAHSSKRIMSDCPRNS